MRGIFSAGVIDVLMETTFISMRSSASPPVRHSAAITSPISRDGLSVITGDSQRIGGIAACAP